MNRYTPIITGLIITSLVLSETIEAGHSFITKEHTHEDNSYLSTNYTVKPVAAATSSGDRAIL